MILIPLTLLGIVGVIIAMTIIVRIDYLNKDVFRFILTGGLNTFNYYLMYLILFEVFDFKYIDAHMLSFLYSAFCSFFVTTMYTFRQRPTLQKAIVFPITFMPNFIISTLGTIILVNNNILTETYASLLAMLVAIPITFIISKLLITGRLKTVKDV